MEGHPVTAGLATAERARALGAAWRVVVESVRRHRLFVAIVLAYYVACYVAAFLTGATRLIDIRPYTGIFTLLLGIMAVALVMGCVFHVVVAVRPKGPLLPAIGRTLFGEVLTADRFANILVPFTVGPLFFSIFGSFKLLIPHMHPFSWDPIFMAWDAALHGGAQPWTWLQPVLGTPFVTSAINSAYDLWFGVMFATFIWQAWSRDREQLRAQFLISFLLCWIVIGTVLATILSSAGPCYYGRVTGLEDPFKPLMDYLRAANDVAPVWALKIQDILWRNYAIDGALPAGGISAMPSMHVAIATLMALLAWRFDRRLGIAYAVFAAIILVGSVHLGWHYAIDGYVSIVATAGIWLVTGAVLRRLARSRPVSLNPI